MDDSNPIKEPAGSMIESFMAIMECPGKFKQDFIFSCSISGILTVGTVTEEPI